MTEVNKNIITEKEDMIKMFNQISPMIRNMIRKEINNAINQIFNKNNINKYFNNSQSHMATDDIKRIGSNSYSNGYHINKEEMEMLNSFKNSKDEKMESYSGFMPNEISILRTENLDESYDIHMDNLEKSINKKEDEANVDYLENAVLSSMKNLSFKKSKKKKNNKSKKNIRRKRK